MSGAAMTIRAARPADATAITRLVRDSFPAEVRGAMIYGAAGAAEWVRAHLALPPSVAERAYTVALAGRVHLAAADLHRAGDTLFLSYIAVAPEARGRGLAARLIAAAIGNAAGPGHVGFALDVFADNLTPRRWYGRLGLEEVGETAWWAIDPATLGGAIDAVEVTVADYPAAAAAQRAFGFSQFRVVTTRATYPVGRVGDAWFRLTDPAALDDPALLAVLRRLDGGRRLLVIGPRDRPPAAAAGPPIAVAVRMRAALAEVRGRLTSRHSAGAPAPAVEIVTA